MPNQSSTPLKAASYARFSSDNQREESIDAQQRAISDFAARNGIEIVAEYVDRAYSARSDQRPEFQQMISDAKSGRFQVVLVHKLDRFSRDRYDSAYYRHELKKHGVTVRSVIENLDDSPESVILQSVIEGMNEYYSRNLARETMKGLKENAYNGKHTGGMPPLGYRVDPETMKIKIDENEANAVRLIFSMADEGKKYPDILAELKSRGFRTKMGKTFTSTSVHDILRNEKYIWICVYNRRVSQSVANNSRKFKDKSEWIVRDDVYPPLIDHEQFNRIQERMKRRRISNQAHPKEVYLLSGKIHCGLCGRAYCGERKTNGKGIVSYSYFCNSRNQAKDERCSNPQVNRSVIESFVLGKLAEYVFTDGMVPKLTESYNQYLNNRVGSSAQRLSQCQSSLREVEQRINRTVELLIDVGSVSLKKKLSDLEKQKAAREKDITALTKLLSENRVTERILKCAFSEIRRALTDGTLANAKQLVDTYIHDVVVYPNRIVVIFNLFPHIKITDRQSGSVTNREESVSAPDMLTFRLSRDLEPEDASGADILRRLRGDDDTSE